MSSYTLICPTIFETQTTGFVGAMEKEFRARKFRVEFHAIAPQVRCLKDSKSVTWDALPAPIRKAAHAAVATFKQANAR